MSGAARRSIKVGGVALVGAALLFVLSETSRSQELVVDNELTYSKGRPVMPGYDGWHRNPDGTIDMWFSYLNQNWQEEPDIPIGPDNNIQPFGPDAGQPTHFQPRSNRWVFKIRVPSDFGTKEVIWTLKSRGKTYRAYGTLNGDYFQDDFGMQRESGTEGPPPENKPPVVRIIGEQKRSAKVGQPVIVSAVTTDDGLPKPQKGDVTKRGSRPVFGLWMSWIVYRGAGSVVFDPPQLKTWEDPLGGSMWSPRWAPPPVPPDNTWSARVTFKNPGEYVVQAFATDGLFFTHENIAFTVTP